MQNAVFWDITPYGSCKNRHFGVTYRLHHRGDKNRRTRNNVRSNLQPKRVVRQFPPKRRFLQVPQGVTSQKTAFFKTNTSVLYRGEQWGNRCRVLMMCYIIDDLSSRIVMKNAVFWVVTPCGSCKNVRCVRRLLVAACVVPSSPIFVTLMMEKPGSSDTPVLTRAIWRNNPEDTILHSHRRENLKSYIELCSFCRILKEHDMPEIRASRSSSDRGREPPTHIGRLQLAILNHYTGQMSCVLT
jgi:hypothetical protein